MGFFEDDLDEGLRVQRGEICRDHRIAGCKICSLRPSPPRLTRYDLIEQITKLVAKRGTCLRAQVGCVIERDGRILSLGYNGSAPGEVHCTEAGCLMENSHCVRTLHAEANAIAWAARRGLCIEGADLWVHGWEKGICDSCRRLVKSAGIATIHCIPLE